jgi:hypothetical protein
MKTIIELRKEVGQLIGLPDSFNGTAGAYAALDAGKQIELTNAMTAYIASHPSEFTTGQVDVAKRVQANGGITAPDEYTFGEAFADFTDEFVAQGGKIVGAAGQSVNRALIVGVIVAILYFGAPYVLPKLKAAFAK